MKISILCSAKDHPINAQLKSWISKNESSHEITLVQRKSELPGGDILFLISCSEIIREEERKLYKKSLVIHASDLPSGRGWSPLIWQVLEGKDKIAVTLLEAADRVDSGDIWHQLEISIPKSALWDEINEILFRAELQLMDFGVASFHLITPRPQNNFVEPSYYPKRNPRDSELDIDKPIREVFNLLRISDPTRYPAYFFIHGERYKITLERHPDGQSI